MSSPSMPAASAARTTCCLVCPAQRPLAQPFTAMATVAGSNPTGTVQFIVSGGGAIGSYVYATAALNSGTASASINLPYSATAYTITAIYSGDAVNAGSTSSAAAVTITPGPHRDCAVGEHDNHHAGPSGLLTATVSSLAGTPTGTVNFTYSTTSNGTPDISRLGRHLNNGTASTSAELPHGHRLHHGNLCWPAEALPDPPSAPMTITVNLPTIIGLPSNPIALPYTMTTIAGGSGSRFRAAATWPAPAPPTNMETVARPPQWLHSAADDHARRGRRSLRQRLLLRHQCDAGAPHRAQRRDQQLCRTRSPARPAFPLQPSAARPRWSASARRAASDPMPQATSTLPTTAATRYSRSSVSTGLMYLVAGTGTAGATGDGSAATSPNVDAPRGVWGDTVGNIYIADTSGNKIRVVDTTGNIHHLCRQWNRRLQRRRRACHIRGDQQSAGGYRRCESECLHRRFQWRKNPRRLRNLRNQFATRCAAGQAGHHIAGKWRHLHRRRQRLDSRLTATRCRCCPPDVSMSPQKLAFDHCRQPLHLRQQRRLSGSWISIPATCAPSRRIRNSLLRRN